MTDFRITFSKTGPLVFISHLDLAHTFVRAFNRAGLPLRYSEGFNPHPKLVFALPLSVGMAGENEMCDVGLKVDMNKDEFEEKIRAVMPAHITIKSVCEAEGKFKNVKSAEYLYTLPETVGICDKIKAFLTKFDIFVTKKTKSGEKEINIKPQIFSFHAAEIDGSTQLVLNVDASSEGYLNPEYVIKALAEADICPLCGWISTRTRIILK